MRVFVLILSALLPVAALFLLFPNVTLWAFERAGVADRLPGGDDLESVLSDCQVENAPGSPLVCPARLPSAAFPPLLRAMVERSEDRRFRLHGAVDWRATAASVPAFAWHAMRSLFHSGPGRLAGGLRGASTLTQQVARVLVVGNQKSLGRKLREMLVADRIEQRRDKDAIEAIYLNVAPLGGGAVGFDAAARRAFGHPAAELDASEAALLVGQLPAPSARDVTVAERQSAADQAGRRVLREALEGKILSPARYAAAVAGLARAERSALAERAAEEPLEIRPYLDLARTELAPGTAPLDGRDRLILNLDPRAQGWVSEQAQAIAGPYTASGLFMRPDGAVVAVGSSDYRMQQSDPAFRAVRSIGSLGKILTLIGGHTTGKLVGSFPFLSREPDAFPRDHDPACLGWLTFRVALAKSCNKAFAHLAERVGPRLATTVASFGFKPPGDLRQVSTGGVQSNLLGVVRMLAGLAAQGLLPQPRALVGVIGPTGAVRQHAERPVPSRTIAPATARAVVRDLRVPVDPAFDGTAIRANSKLTRIWGKTGTSADNRDAWFAGGMTSGQGTPLVGGFWIGANDDRPMPGVVGGGGPARAFRSVAEHVVRVAPVSNAAPRPAFWEWLRGATVAALVQLATLGFAALRAGLLVLVAVLSLRVLRWSRRTRPVPAV